MELDGWGLTFIIGGALFTIASAFLLGVAHGYCLALRDHTVKSDVSDSPSP